MDFSLLNSVNDLQKSQGKKRKQRSEVLFDKALNYIAIYQQTRDKTQLTQALNYLEKATENAQSVPEPYLALAYLFALFQNPDLAIKYLKIAQALQCDPELFQKVQAEVTETLNATQLKVQHFLALESRFEESLNQLLHFISAQALPENPKASQTQLEHAQHIYTQISAQKSKIEELLLALDACGDTQNFHRQMQVVNQRELVWKHYCEKIIECLAIEDKIVSVIENVSRAQDLGYCSESLLEQWLDACDWIADRLDELLDQAYPITELEQHYSQLIELLTQYQERMDSN